MPKVCHKCKLLYSVIWDECLRCGQKLDDVDTEKELDTLTKKKRYKYNRR